MAEGVSILRRILEAPEAYLRVGYLDHDVRDNSKRQKDQNRARDMNLKYY